MTLSSSIGYLYFYTPDKCGKPSIFKKICVWLFPLQYSQVTKIYI